VHGSTAVDDSSPVKAGDGKSGGPSLVSWTRVLHSGARMLGFCRCGHSALRSLVIGLLEIVLFDTQQSRDVIEDIERAKGDSFGTRYFYLK
jgi:hypothetical protein